MMTILHYQEDTIKKNIFLTYSTRLGALTEEIVITLTNTYSTASALCHGKAIDIVKGERLRNDSSLFVT